MINTSHGKSVGKYHMVIRVKLDMRYLPDGGIEVRNGAIKLGIIKESWLPLGGIKMPPAEVKIILFM